MGWKMKTIKQISQTLQSDEKLLSSYNAEWWEFYLTNSNYFDRYFIRKYKSFCYFDQDKNETDEQVKDNFISACYDWLLVNDKRYSELYRINVVPDNENYSITENYFLSETYSGTNGNQSAIINGQRTDVNNVQVGSQNFEELNKTTPFNSGSELETDSTINKSGTRNDITQFTQGQQTTTSNSTGTDGHTLTRHGAIGTMTVDDVLKKHLDVWSGLTAFYDFVMRELSEQYLLVRVDNE